ncbi:MAG: putative pyruvate formate lyase activating enzyme [Archaeoglobi archaeon]|nr:putative pyruvate formate lyase activating enzyme [Archaeoglobi archaeon]
MEFEPSYLELMRSGELKERIRELYSILESCELCPRKCHVNRMKGEEGYCRSDATPMVSSYFPHFGEEDVLVGRNGSGTIFLTNCNLLCVYCQNYDISHLGIGEAVSEERIAEMMLHLQTLGCHNINFVTPTHYTPQLVKAIEVAAERGLRLPIVWNCSGYENVEIIRLLEGIVDIYMPDMKYSSEEPARKYSNAPDYFERCKEAVKEMHRQVGDLKVDERGIAYRGLIIRHLVLPNDLAGSEEILRFIAEEISRNTYVNIMAQYRPEGEAYRYEELNRRITREEFMRVIEIAKKLNLRLNLV